MPMNPLCVVVAGLCWLVAPLASQSEAPDRPPNVVIIVSDDAGYADFSMHGSEQIATPRIDSIAERGMRFRQGYVSASVCSPSRAGLMTGRYQQRFGHEHNIPPRYSEGNGLPVEERTIADLLGADDLYRTIALGKWHLGYAPKFHPLSRGFDDYWGFLQGARSFFSLGAKATRLNRLLRDREPIEEDFDYMTDALGDEAAAYIEKHRERPFFLYLAFNAVHTPMHAKKEVLAAVEGVKKPRRRKLVAMTRSLDAAVGRVLDALEEHGLTDDTLLVFVNDNGGATNNASQNGALRGKKGSPFEGGIRVPFALQWPRRIPARGVFDAPVSTLDLLPTALAAAGVEVPPEVELDGVDLLPFLSGEEEGRPHEQLFWRRGKNRAVRWGDLKLVRQGDGPWLLFDLAADESETEDLSADRGDDVKRIAAAYERWDAQLTASRWGYGRKKR